MDIEYSPATGSSNPSLGQRLQAERLAQGLSIEDICQRLKLPETVVVSMETDDYDKLGAAVFARGRLGNYARLLGVPMAAVDAVFARMTRELPALVTTRSTSKFERFVQRSARQGIYVALTAIIFVVPVVWIANGNRLPDARSSLGAPQLTPLDTPAGKPNAGQRGSDPSAGLNQPPVVASMASFPNDRQPSVDNVESATGVAASPLLQLRFSGDSWIEVLDRDGRILEQDTPGAGARRSWPISSVSQVTLGSADVVQASKGGRVLDLTPYRRANRARFTLSLDGSLTPAPDR